jgi:hypothetical protein
MAKGKTFLICCDKADLPEHTREMWFLKKHERVILQLSSRVYHEIRKIQDEKTLDTKQYRWANRRVVDLLNGKDELWINVGNLYHVVKHGTVM